MPRADSPRCRSAWKRTGKLDESDLNHLQSAQLNQRQVEKLLGGGAEGVEGQIEALLGGARGQPRRGPGHRRADERPARQEFANSIASRSIEISRQLDRGLQDGPRSGWTAARAGRCGCRRLQAAAARQDEVIQSLEGLLGTLTEWDSFSRLAREIGQIRSEQEQLAERPRRCGWRRSRPTTLSADERATARQLRAAASWSWPAGSTRSRAAWKQMLGRLQSTDPRRGGHAGRRARCRPAAWRSAGGCAMRPSGSASCSSASRISTQAAALDGLKQLLDLLSSRREDELARTIKSLRAAAGDLAGLLAATGSRARRARRRPRLSPMRRSRSARCSGWRRSWSSLPQEVAAARPPTAATAGRRRLRLRLARRASKTPPPAQSAGQGERGRRAAAIAPGPATAGRGPAASAAGDRPGRAGAGPATACPAWNSGSADSWPGRRTSSPRPSGWRNAGGQQGQLDGGAAGDAAKCWPPSSG